MNASRTPQGHTAAWLASPLVGLTRLVLRGPRRIVVLALLLAAAALGGTAWRLEFRSSRLDLLNPASAYNQRWLRYLDEFGREDDVVVVVAAPTADDTHRVLQRIDERLSGQPEWYRDVLVRRELSPLRRKGLHFLSDEQLSGLEGLVSQYQSMRERDWTGVLVPSPAAPPDQLAGVLDGLEGALGESPRFDWPGPPLPDLSSELDQLGDTYLSGDAGTLGFLLLRLPPTASGQPDAEALEHLRQDLAAVRTQFPEARLGLTGMPVLEYDEMQASQTDSLRASVFSLAGVALVFIVGFGGLRYPLLTVAVLLVGMAWTMGYTTLAVGHLNILSVAFGVILIGLGIDFGVHFVARYVDWRVEGLAVSASLLEAMREAGPGILTGGTTTSLAFFTAALTPFTGIAELGVIAGGGLLLCMLAALVLLPALVAIQHAKWPDQQLPRGLPLEWLIRRLDAHPLQGLLLCGLLIAVAASGIPRLRFDHNLLNLQPEGLASVAWEKKLVGEMDQSVWFALSICDSPAQLAARRAAFEQLETVQSTEDLGGLLPEVTPGREAIIRRIGQRLADLPAGSVEVPPLALSELDSSLARCEQSVAPQLAARIQAFRERLGQLPTSFTMPRLTEYRRQLAEQWQTAMRGIAAAADPAPPSVDDLPAPLRARFVGATGRYLMRIYARGDIWDMDRLERFVADIERVDPHVTGHPVQTYYASRQMLKSYLGAAVYALLAVGIVLMLDFQSIRHSLLALLPVGLGLAMLFGILGHLDVPLNPANMIVLPLILGIGIDDGVHVVHDFRRCQGRYALGNSTARAIIITSATTMVGFGSLMLAHHRGLFSLGLVLTLGVACCLLTSLAILPGLLTLCGAWRLAASSSEATENEATENGAAENGATGVAATTPRPTAVDFEAAEIPAAHRPGA